MKNYFLQIILFLLVVFSCSTGDMDNLKDVVKFTYKSFPNTERIIGNKISKFKLGDPDNIYVFDSLLVIIDNSTPYLINVYSLKSGNKINELVRRGKGPFELISLDYLQKINSTKQILLFGTKMKKVIELSYSDLTKESSDINFSEFRIKDQGCMRIVKNKDTYIGLSLRDSIINRLYTFNDKGNFVNGFGDYPSFVPKVGHMLDAYLFDAYHNVLANGTTVLSYRNMDFIEIYDSNYNLVKQFWGPDGALPDYELLVKGTFSMVRFKKDQIDAYGKIIVNPNNDNFWMSYSGRILATEGYLDSTIFVFSDKGDFLRRYDVDVPFLSMDVNFKTKTFYTLTYPETEIYEYEF